MKQQWILCLVHLQFQNFHAWMFGNFLLRPGTGTTIEFTNGATSFAVNNLIIDRNGNTIDDTASDLTVSADPVGGVLTMIYDGSTWRSR